MRRRLEFQYRGAVLGGVVCQVFFGLILIAIYRALYAGKPQAMPLSQITSYVWLQQAFFRMLLASDPELMDKIRTGSIAYDLCRPLNLYGFYYVRIMAQKMTGSLLRAAPMLLFAFLLPEGWGLMLPASATGLIWSLAGLLLGGLLSDTMNLQTPTTTDKDRQTANILAALAGLDLDVFTEELFSVTEDEGGSLEELMNRDIVFEDIMGIRLMITKVNVPQVEPYRDRADEMQQALDVLTKNKNADIGILSITSALENSSILFASGSKADWVFEAFPDAEGEAHSVQEGLVSRKMQMIPKLSVVINKYA